jgi:hypothetical protein
VRLRPLGMSATNLSGEPAPYVKWWWVWSSRWNENWQEKPKNSEKTCLSATLSTANPTWPDLRSNTGRRCGKPVTENLSYGTVFDFIITTSYCYISVSCCTGKLFSLLGQSWRRNFLPCSQTRSHWGRGFKTDLRELQLYSDALALIWSAHWHVLLALHVAMIREETKMKARFQRIEPRTSLNY